MLNFLLQIKFDEHTFFLCERPDKQLNDEYIQNLLREAHGNVATGYLGENKTIKRLCKQTSWENMGKDAIDFVKTCKVCQQEKLTRIRPKIEAVISEMPTQPNDKIAMDIVGPLSETMSGNKFENLFRIKHIKKTALHPQSDGALERIYGTIKDLLKSYMADNQTEWDQNLNLVCIAFYTTVHESTGLTPFEMTGRKANLVSVLVINTSLTLQELLDIWQTRHEKYL